MVLKLNISEKARIIKNLLALNVAFFLTFAAQNSIISIQSVLNETENLGLASTCISFGFQLLTCLVFPLIVIEGIGFKWAMTTAQVFYTLLIAANAFPRWYTLAPAAALNGIAQSLAWNILGIYVSLLSKQYARCTKLLFENVQYLFFAVFTAIFLSSYALGSILIATVLQSEDIASNSTFDYSGVCGVNNCGSDKLPESSTKPSTSSVYVLCGILVAICLVGIVSTILFMDHVDMNDEEEEEKVEEKRESIIHKIGSRFKNEFVSMVKLLGCLDTYLLLPMSIYTGFELTFMWNEVNRSFISCLKSVNFVGWTNIFFGIAGGLFSVFFGYVARYTTLIPQIVLTFCLAMGQAVFVLAWTPNVATSTTVIFLMTLVFAITESIATVQIRGLYGLQFPGNLNAFSIASISQTIGFIIGLVCSLVFCTRTKTYIYFGLSLLSLITYTIMFSRNNYRKAKEAEQESIKRIQRFNSEEGYVNGSFNKEYIDNGSYKV